MKNIYSLEVTCVPSLGQPDFPRGPGDPDFPPGGLEGSPGGPCGPTVEVLV